MSIAPRGNPIVHLYGVGRRFGGRVALAEIDLEIVAGERVAILGPSGAGKSTLLAVLSGALAPTEGEVEVLGTSIHTVSDRARRRVQSRIGSVGQRLDLIEQVRVLHNVDAGRLARWGTLRSLLALAWPRVDNVSASALDSVGLGWAVHEPTALLSGGERQRVAIARMLVQRPELVLADEPVSSLDPTRADEVLRLIQRPADAVVTSIVSLHQPELARRHCTRAIGLRAGRLVFDVPQAELDERLLAELYESA